jgi:voltage-gated potassium channel
VADTITTRKRANVWRRLSRRFVLLTILALGVLVACPLLMYAFEQNVNGDIDTVLAAYQWLGRTLFEGGSAYDIETTGGLLVSYAVGLSGVSVVAFATGAISSRLVAAVVTKGKGMGETRQSGHIVICGWSSKAVEIIRELRAEQVDDPRPVVVLADLEGDPSRGLAEFIAGDPSDAEDLVRAGVHNADTAIVLADERHANDGDRDARTLLTCLAIEAVNPNCYTCVEVVKSENRPHFGRAKADEMVVSAELTGALLASSARTHGLSHVVTDLLTHPQGMEIYRIPVPAPLVGRNVREMLGWVKDELDAVALGVASPGTAVTLNPPGDRVLATDDELLLVASTPPDEVSSRPPPLSTPSA